jgi:hypothetical protein
MFWLSVLGFVASVLLLRQMPQALWFFNRKHVRWVQTEGQVITTSINVRKQTNPLWRRARIDFLIQIEFSYRNSAAIGGTGWVRQGTHEIAVPRLHLAREIAAYYHPGRKVTVNYNADDVMVWQFRDDRPLTVPMALLLIMVLVPSMLLFRS